MLRLNESCEIAVVSPVLSGTRQNTLVLEGSQALSFCCPDNTDIANLARPRYTFAADTL